MAYKYTYTLILVCLYVDMYVLYIIYIVYVMHGVTTESGMMYVGGLNMVDAQCLHNLFGLTPYSTAGCPNSTSHHTILMHPAICT